MMPDPLLALRIREFEATLARDFHAINAEWITAMFSLEATDREVLENPQERIIDGGGAILFVEAEGVGIVGTCALQRTGAGRYELTKMGVRESARGLKAGEFLLHAVIDRAAALNAELLYLLTNAKCAAAVHLYEKLGFVHDPAIKADYGARYQRCDVAMRYAGLLEGSTTVHPRHPELVSGSISQPAPLLLDESDLAARCGMRCPVRSRGTMDAETSSA